jgi:hypothetical protein
MYFVQKRTRGWSAIASMCLLSLSVACLPALAADAGSPSPIRIAVFDFEVEDVSPAASQPGRTPADSARLQAVTNAARRVLAQSGHYSIVDVSKADAAPVRQKSLRDCDGCEAGIGLQLGAEQALVGVVRRVSMTDYYVMIQISDCRTGKVLTQQAANFAGGEEGWASGVATMIRHQVLVDDKP